MQDTYTTETLLSLSVTKRNGWSCGGLRGLAEVKTVSGLDINTIEEYKALLEATSDVSAVVDEDGVIKYQSPSTEQVLGYEPDELVGQDAIDYIHPDDRESVRKIFSELTKNEAQSTARAELRFQHADGSWVWLESSGTNRTHTALDGYVITSRDITGLRQLEEQYQYFVEQSSDIISVLDETATVVYISPQVERVCGYKPKELIGEYAFEFVHPDDTDQVVETFERGLEQPGYTTTTQFRYPHADGGWMWLESRSRSLPDGGPMSGRTVVSTRDITERKHREQELEQYKTAMETVPDGVVLLDERGTMTRVNEAWASIFGREPEELNQEPFRTLIDEGAVNESVAEAYVDVVQRLLSDDSDRQQASFTTQVTPPETSRERFYEIRIRLLPSDGEFRGTAAVVRDITDHVQRRKQLARENERLDEFASMVSHDLRNPLSIMEGSLELLDVENEHVERAQRAVDRMEQLIDDLLVLARHGDAVTDTEVVTLSTVAWQAWRTVQTGGAELTIESDGRLEADTGRLQQLFENLFRNSIEHGGPNVTVRIGAEENYFYVADDGEGFGDVDTSEIFESGYSTSSTGTGFGLDIVEQIVGAHGWSVHALSSVDDGARFEIQGVDIDK